MILRCTVFKSPQNKYKNFDTSRYISFLSGIHNSYSFYGVVSDFRIIHYGELWITYTELHKPAE